MCRLLIYVLFDTLMYEACIAFYVENVLQPKIGILGGDTLNMRMIVVNNNNHPHGECHKMCEDDDNFF